MDLEKGDGEEEEVGGVHALDEVGQGQSIEEQSAVRAYQGGPLDELPTRPLLLARY